MIKITKIFKQLQFLCRKEIKGTAEIVAQLFLSHNLDFPDDISERFEQEVRKFVPPTRAKSARK